MQPPTAPGRVLKFPPQHLRRVVLDEAATGALVAIAHTADGLIIETADGRFLVREETGRAEPLSA